MSLRNKFILLIREPLWGKLVLLRKVMVVIVMKLLYKRIFKKFGKSSILYPHLMLRNPERIEIGDRVQIRGGARIEAIVKWQNTIYDPKIIIEDDVSIEQRCNITCAGKIEIKKNAVISFDVTITDIDHQYKDIGVNVLQQPLLVKEVTIGECCFIGAGSKIFAGSILGKQCIVAANSVVRGTFPDYTVIAGVPARPIKQYNFTTQEWEKINHG